MKKKIIITITLVCMILCSFFVVGNIASNPQNHQKAIKYLDQKKANVLKLTALVDDVIDSNHFDTGRYGNAYRDEAGGSYFMVFADLMHDFFGKIFANDNRLCSI